MPSLIDVVNVLQAYEGRYEALDAFVDDIIELKLPYPQVGVNVIAHQPRPLVETWVGGQHLAIEIFQNEGIARFRLLPEQPQPQNTVQIGAAIGAALGAAVGAATDRKEGLLSGLALGMLLGGLLGAAAAPPDRALALQFDAASASWRLYDGPLRSWAKRTLIPIAQ